MLTNVFILVTPLETTTLTTAGATTLPITTAQHIATQTGNSQPNSTGPYSISDKYTESSPSE